MERYLETLPKAVLFDWDNTLVDSWRVTFDALNLTFEQFEKPPITIENFFSRPHLSLKDSFPSIFQDQWTEALKVFYDAYDALHLEELIMMPGAKELVHLLYERNVYLGVISNKKGSYLRTEIEHFGLSSLFSYIVGSGDLHADKPSPIPVQAALDHAKLNPSHHIWFIGDSSVDVDCAKAAGCLPLVVGDALPSHEAYLHVKDCANLALKISQL